MDDDRDSRSYKCIVIYKIYLGCINIIICGETHVYYKLQLSDNCNRYTGK